MNSVGISHVKKVRRHDQANVEEKIAVSGFGVCEKHWISRTRHCSQRSLAEIIAMLRRKDRSSLAMTV